jgi:hypothetical protein
MRLASALEGQHGLDGAHANLMGEVTLTWNDELTSRAALTQVLAGAGFHELRAPPGIAGLHRPFTIEERR